MPDRGDAPGGSDDPDAGPSAAGGASGDADPPSRSGPDAPPTDYAFVDEALDRSGAAGFVAVGAPRDPDVRYLARLPDPVPDPDAPVAFVYAGGDAVLVVPASGPERFDARAARAFPGDVVAADGAPVGDRAASVLAARTGGDGRVLVPRDVPHDAALYLERAGYDLASTRATADARARKTDAELAALRFVAAAAARGLDRAAEVLSAAAPEDGELRWTDAALTPERLRREANAAMARAGVDPAGDTAVAAGPPRDARARDAPVRPGETVTVDLAPRGPYGYRSVLARTFVVAGGGGWERRAHVAVTAARRAGLAAVEPGAPARRVRDEVVAELAAHGFDAGTGAGAGADADAGSSDADTGVGLFGPPGHGVGLSRREAPSLDASDALEPGHVLAVAPGLAHPDRGAVRVAGVVAVTENGHESLASVPSSLSP